MATQLDPNVKDDLKTQFVTREGTYRLLTHSEYSRPNRVGYTSNQGSPQVRVSIVTLPSNGSASASGNGNGGNGGNAAGGGTLNGNANGSTGSSAKGGGDGPGNNGAGMLVNGQPQTAFSVPATMDARLGAGISMHTMINGAGGGEQNGMSSQIYGGDRICFNFGRELYVYAFRGVKKVSKHYLLLGS